MFAVLDPRQLARIEAVHRGFLYQHLYTVGCLLLAAGSHVRSITAEFDEDVEIEFESGDRIYIQVKTRSTPLIWSDISGALARFEELQNAHSSGQRSGAASFAIVANVPAGPELSQLVQVPGLPYGALLVTPESPDGLACLPPAWPSVIEALTWCAERATTLPLLTIPPATLTWKLAGLVMLAAAGQAPGHSFEVANLPEIFEQLVVQLQPFPAPPETYRPQENEPLFISDARVRIISGLSGAGKTAWASHVATHATGHCAYFDVGDMPGPAIAASLVRELGAQWAAPGSDGLRKALLPGATGIESLRALDQFLAEHGIDGVVIIDNAHRVPVEDLRMLTRTAAHVSFVLLAQPTRAVNELEGILAVEQERLEGWRLDQIAQEAHALDLTATVSDLRRLLALTGGLPLYVRTAVQLVASQYQNVVGALCSALEASAHLAETTQEQILARVFDALPESTRDCVSVLSLCDVPLHQNEAACLVGSVLDQNAATLAESVRQLYPIGVVRIFSDQRLQIHDAFRLLGMRRFAAFSGEMSAKTWRALKEVLLQSLETHSDTSRFRLLIRTLVELQELDTLLDVATEEWFHELGVDGGIWAALEDAGLDTAIDPEQRFHAHDGLAFARMKSGNFEQVEFHIAAMEALVVESGLGERERMVALLKRMILESAQGNVETVGELIERIEALAPVDPEHLRIVRYNIALALQKIGFHHEARQRVEKIVEEYYAQLGLSPDDVLMASNAAIFEKLQSTPSLTDDLKHLADSLVLLAQATNSLGKDAVFARIHAMKFYGLATAVNSLISVGQDLVDEFIERGDYHGSREVIEQHVLPAIKDFGMMERMLSVRGQYAVVLAYCGEYGAAEAEVARLEAYGRGLLPNQRSELESQKELILGLRTFGAAYVRRALMRGAAVIDRKIGRNEPCICGSGRKYKRCHGA